MISELDIYRAANELIRQYGDEAAIHAAMRADALAERGDLDGYAVWRGILTAIDVVMAGAIAPGRNVN